MPDSPPESSQATAPAWNASELASNPHVSSEKAGKVRRMFAAIANSYDLNNRLHSFGRDQAWRRAAVKLARVSSDDAVLDIACGTGDLSEAFVEAGAQEVVGGDFTPEMLEHAARKSIRFAEDLSLIHI